MQELTDIEFLRLLERRGIEVRAKQDRLRINAPAAALDKPLQDELVRRKGGLLALLGDAGKPLAAPDKTKAVPLTHGQKSIWLVERFHPGTAAYSIPQALSLDASIDLALLQEAIDRLIERHEILRSYVATQGGEGVLHIVPQLRVPVRFTDLSALDENQCRERLRELLRQESRHPFNLAEPPLFRCHLFRLAASAHVMHLNVHHILADEWSLGILERDVRAFYAAAATGRDAGLPQLAMQYSDYAIWEQEQVQESWKMQLAYWKAKLSDAPAHLELPFSRPRPLVQSFAGEVEPYSIPEDIADRLRQLARSENASLFMLLLAAFSVLLHRYTGGEDFCIGSPISGRTRVETEELIGLFINTLVFRCQPMPSWPFRRVLRQVRDTALEAYSNSNMPFQKLVAELHPERDAASSAIFQIMFLLHTAGQEKPDSAAHIDMEPGISKFDLTLQLTDSGESIRGGIEYRTDLFDPADIQQFAGSFSMLLEEIAREPDRPIASLNLLSSQERQRILVDWNGTESAWPGYATVVEWFRAQAAATPEATAVEMGGHSLSYAELDRQSSLLADGLRKRGVGREVVVGLYVSRSFNMVVGLLGILKAGGAYLPLDPAFPDERIEFLLRDGNVALILTEASLKAALPESHAALLALDEAWEESPAAALHSSDEPPGGEDLAYLIYTSGSTGEPKGTEIRHGALVNLLASMLREPGLRKEDTLVAVTTLSFDIAGLEIFGPLVCGARLVLASREQAQDPQVLAELLDRAGGTVMQATPSTWRMLVESGWKGKPDLRMWCGGEALSPDLAESLLARGGELWNMYGPTETTIWSAAHRVSRGEDPIPIGQPIANTQMYILDAQGEPVPIGVAGELYIAGDGVARGYWKRPELTETRFVPDPFSGKANRRMYRTGDLARYRRDGQIQWLGRTDQQIKLRGYRIELGEIEAVLLRHPQVAGAMVFVYQDPVLGPSLVAFVLAKQGQTIDVEDLVAFERSALPAYMVASQIVPREDLILTPNGKIDRKAMISSFERPPASSTLQQEPRDDVERVLVEIWQESFGRAPIGIDDDFFALGGHSLLAVRVFSEIERRLGKMVMLSVLFQAPTIRQLANVIRN